MSREENQNPVPASDLGMPKVPMRSCEVYCNWLHRTSGEFIETQVVPINGLYARLKGMLNRAVNL